jgi:hypothetical protein
MGEGKRGRGDEVRLHVNYYEVSFSKLRLGKSVGFVAELRHKFPLVFAGEAGIF